MAMKPKANYTNTFKGAKKATAPISAAKQPRNTQSGNSVLNRMRKPNQSYAGNSNAPAAPLRNATSIEYAASKQTRLAMPILSNPANEQLLVRHIKDRLAVADIERQKRIIRCEAIDTQLSGFVKLDADDKKRQKDNLRGKAPKPTKHNLPLAASQIDEGCTYLMSVFAPDMDIFTASSSVKKQPVANGLTQEINAQGQRAQYYRHFAKMCLNSLKYNFGGLTCVWEKHMGYVFNASGGGQIEKKIDVVWEGNIIKSVDAYNFFFDTTVHPVDLPLRGEFYAEAMLLSPWRAAKMQNDNLLYGIDRCVDPKTGAAIQGDAGNTWYVEPPIVRDYDTTASQGKTDFQSALRAGAGSKDAPDSTSSIELVYFTGWVMPGYFGLSTSKNLELWRIGLLQNKYIGYAVQLDDTHGMLPCAISTPLEDDLKNEQRTFAEQLIPLQHFASFLLNTHQDAVRKALYGITVFNAHAFPGLDKSTEELIGAKIPLRSSSTDTDIDKIFRHYTAAPGTDQNVDMIEKINGLMQKILPTDMLKQVADLERATLYQAAATVQSGNRRNLKIARLISDQCLTYIKFQMLYNIYANITQIDYIDQLTGKESKISPSDLIDAKLELDVGTGLKGIDRLMQLQIWQSILTAVIQSREAFQEVDIVELIAYYAGLAGDTTDFNQFRRTATGNAPPPQTAPVQSNNGTGTQVPAVPGANVAAPAG